MTTYFTPLYTHFDRKTFVAATALVTLLLLTTTGIRAQVATGEVNGTCTSDYGPAKFHGYVVFIQNPQKNVTPLVTKPPTPACRATPCPLKTAPLLTTYDWAQQVGAFVAINASFGEPEPEFKPCDCRYVFGPVKSNGVLVASSIPRPDNQGNPAILFDSNGVPSIKMATEIDVNLACNVISGQWEDTPQFGNTGSLLIQNKKLMGKTALPVPEEPDSRTAVGLTTDGTLILIVIEKNPLEMTGITLPALAKLLLTLGADNAINLDGGGSSTITYMPDSRVKMEENEKLYELMKAGQTDFTDLSFNFTQRDPRIPFSSRPLDKIGLWNYLYRPVTIHFGFAPYPPQKCLPTRRRGSR